MEEPRYFYGRLRDALQPKDQSNTAFYVDQLERCYEALREACKNATRDEQGKPIFYYVKKGAGAEEGTVMMSFHYICAQTAELHNLNYVTAIITEGVGLREPNDGVFFKEEEYASGEEVIKRLSRKSCFIEQSTNLITAKVL